MQIRSGHVYIDYNSSAYNLHTGKGYRIYTVYVRFKVPFANIPEVMVGLYGLDSSKSTNIRIRCHAQDITQTGFNMYFTTWSDTEVYGVGSNWIAYDEEPTVEESTLIE